MSEKYSPSQPETEDSGFFVLPHSVDFENREEVGPLPPRGVDPKLDALSDKLEEHLEHHRKSQQAND